MDKEITVYRNNPGPEDEGQPDLETLLLLMRLLVGGAAEGVDELVHRLKERQSAASQDHPVDTAIPGMTGLPPTNSPLRGENSPASPPAGGTEGGLSTKAGIAAVGMTIFSPDETELDRFRYALIGLLFEAPEQIARTISEAHQTTQKAAHLVDRLFSPITNSPLMRPLRRRQEARRARLEARLERLIELGRVEEQLGRRLARESTAEAMDQFFAYLAQNPELRQVLQQQSVGLTNEAVGRLRQRSAEADRLLDRMAGAILRRPAPPAAQAPTPPDAADLPASPSEDQRYGHE